MTWLVLVRELAPKHVSAHFFSLESYFCCVTTVTYSPQSTCIEGKTSSTPGFTFIAILSLTLDIGANPAIFTLLNAILLRPLPVQKPSELLLFGNVQSQGSRAQFPTGTRSCSPIPSFAIFARKILRFQESPR